MRNEYWREQKSWPISQTILSWMVVILFVVAASDWNFWRGMCEKHQKNQETSVYPGTPEYDQVIAELDGILKTVEQKAKDGSLTAKEAAEKQMMFVDICCRKGLKWDHYTEVTYLVAEECFVANWKPTAATPDFVLKDMEKDPEYKRQLLKSRFGDDFFRAQDEARELYPNTKKLVVNGWVFWTLFKWAFKWYWLLTLPSLVILLINRRYKGDSLKEELILDPRRLLLACCGGPIGIVCISETAARAMIYNQLEEGFRLTHDYRWPDAQEQQALLRQLEEPLLRFDEALEQVKGTTIRIRRPIMVCLLAWIISIMHQPMARQSKTAVTTISATTDSMIGKSFKESDIISAGNKKVPCGIDLLLAVLPGSVAWEHDDCDVVTIVELRQRPQPIHWLIPMPRAPPAAAEGQPLFDKSFTLVCTQKG